MNIGKEINYRLNHATFHNVYKPTRELIFETMWGEIRSPLRKIIKIPVRDSVPNPINIII